MSIHDATPARTGTVAGIDAQTGALLVAFHDWPGPPQPVMQPSPLAAKSAAQVGDTVLVHYGGSGYPLGVTRLGGTGSVNSGTATTTAATSVIVPHGLATTPTQVQVSPSSNPGGAWWVTAVGPTTFTIALAVSGTVGFYWAARIGNNP